MTILDVGPGKVRLGFEAEVNVSVHRWEVWQRICAGERPENRWCAGRSAGDAVPAWNRIKQRKGSTP
jgi:sRNA-binding carbon storage regulator CsrA